MASPSCAARSNIPIIADESCKTAADIPALVGKVDGINIKLAKCGSLREAHPHGGRGPHRITCRSCSAA